MAKTLISGPKFFFREFYFYQLDIVPSYHPMQFKGKLMDQTWENGEEPNFWPVLARLSQIWSLNFFL